MAEAEDIHLAENKTSKDLGRQALRGGAVSVVSRLVNGVIQIGSTIVLARLLTPTDYGLVAMVAVLTSFAPLLIDFGLGDATTQREKITQGQVSCLFWISSGVGLLLTLLMAGCSSLIAGMYHEPRLKPIAMASAVSFILLGISGQHFALLKRNLEFSRIARIEIASNLLSAVLAIGLALRGFGYWGLVLRPVTNAGCMTVGAWWACRWRPGWPVFDSEVKKLVRFGMHVVGFTLTYSAGKAADRFSLGLCYPAREVGYYQNGMNLYENSIFAVLNPLHTVGSAALSKLQSVPELLRQKYATALSALAFFMMPAAGLLSVVSVDLVVWLLGEKWRMAGVLLGILALRGMVHVIEGSQGWLHLSTGRPDRWMKWGVVSAVLQAVAVVAGLPFGARGVAAGFVASGWVIAFPSILYAGRPIGIGFRDVWNAVGKQLVGAILMTAAGWWLRLNVLANAPGFYRICLLSLVCALVYLLIEVALFRLTEPIRVGWRLVGEHLPDEFILKARRLAGRQG
jgi:PST family polysaccharide transporter